MVTSRYLYNLCGLCVLCPCVVLPFVCVYYERVCFIRPSLCILSKCSLFVLSVRLCVLWTCVFHPSFCMCFVHVCFICPICLYVCPCELHQPICLYICPCELHLIVCLFMWALFDHLRCLCLSPFFCLSLCFVSLCISLCCIHLYLLQINDIHYTIWSITMRVCICVISASFSKKTMLLLCLRAHMLKKHQ